MILSITYTLLKINEPWYTDVLFSYEMVPVSRLSNDNVLWIVCRQCRRSTANRAQPLAASEQIIQPPSPAAVCPIPAVKAVP